MPRRLRYRPFDTVPAGARRVDRGTRYGNPFKLARYGDPAEPAEVVTRYRAWITSPEQAGLLGRARRELRGLDLMCTCGPHLPCHADVLLELVNAD
jgi:Domain of unknown function (DUF4326)